MGDSRSVPREARDHILAAALKAFARDTFDGASLPDIAREAGIGSPLIHYHFGSKENLWRATVDYAFQELSRPFDTIVTASRDLEPKDAIKMLCRALVRFSSEYPEHVLVLMNEVSSPGERLDWVTERYLRRIHKRMDEMIELAAARGQIKSIPTVHLTNIIIAAITHFFSTAPLIESLYGVKPSDPDVSVAHSDWVIEIIFRGIDMPASNDPK